MAYDDDDDETAFCAECDNEYPARRLELGYMLCRECGDKAAVAARQHWTVALIHKSNYQLITDHSLLKHINNKGGNTR